MKNESYFVQRSYLLARLLNGVYKETKKLQINGVYKETMKLQIILTSVRAFYKGELFVNFHPQNRDFVGTKDTLIRRK